MERIYNTKIIESNERIKIKKRALPLEGWPRTWLWKLLDGWNGVHCTARQQRFWRALVKIGFAGYVVMS